MLLGVATGIRAWAWSQTVVLFNDGPVFLSLAEAMAQGRWDEVFAHPYHPLYPFCIRLVGLLPIHLETAGVVVSIAGGVLAVAALYAFFRDAFGPEIAWLGGWIAALHPWAVDFSSDVMSDGLYAGLYLWSFAWLARAVERRATRAAAVAGVLAGLAYWVRPEGLGLVFVGVVLLAWRGVVEEQGRWHTLVAALGLVVAGLLVVSPYVAALGEHTGEWRWTQKKSIEGLVTRGEAAHPPSASETKASGPAPSSSKPIVLPELAERLDGPAAQRPPRSWLGLLEAGTRVLRTTLAALRYEVLVFVGLGLVFLRDRSRRWRDRTLALTTLAYGGLLVLLVWGAGYVSRRHALAFVLPWLGFAAVGWQGVLGGLLEGRWSTRFAGPGERWDIRRRSRWTLWVLIGLLVIAWGPRDLRERRTDRAPIRAASEWLARHHPDSGPVASQKLRAAYYAGAAYVPLPSGRDGLLEQALRARGTRWIVIDETKTADHEGLVEGLGRWLRPVHRAAIGDRAAVVLAILPSAAPGAGIWQPTAPGQGGPGDALSVQ